MTKRSQHKRIHRNTGLWKPFPFHDHRIDPTPVHRETQKTTFEGDVSDVVEPSILCTPLLLGILAESCYGHNGLQIWPPNMASKYSLQIFHFWFLQKELQLNISDPAPPPSPKLIANTSTKLCMYLNHLVLTSMQDNRPTDSGGTKPICGIVLIMKGLYTWNWCHDTEFLYLNDLVYFIYYS